MHPEIGASELLVIAIVALIFVGPKDLPILLRRIGQFTAKLRNMASEFRASFDDMARQSELDELRREVAAMRRGDFGAASDMASTVSEIEASMAETGVQLHPPMSYQFTATDEPPALEPPKPVRKRAAKPKAAAAKAKPAASATVKTASRATRSKKTST